MKVKLFTLIIECKIENEILNKITNVLVKFKINISSIYSIELGDENNVHIILEMYSSDSYLAKVIEGMKTIKGVNDVIIKHGNNMYKKKLGLFKINTETILNNSQLCNQVKNSNAEIIEIQNDFTIIQLVSSDQKISELYHLLKPYGISEYSKGSALISLP